MPTVSSGVSFCDPKASSPQIWLQFSLRPDFRYSTIQYKSHCY